MYITVNNNWSSYRVTHQHMCPSEKAYILCCSESLQYYESLNHMLHKIVLNFT